MSGSGTDIPPVPGRALCRGRGDKALAQEAFTAPEATATRTGAGNREHGEGRQPRATGNVNTPPGPFLVCLCTCLFTTLSVLFNVIQSKTVRMEISRGKAVGKATPEGRSEREGGLGSPDRVAGSGEVAKADRQLARHRRGSRRVGNLFFSPSRNVVFVLT